MNIVVPGSFRNRVDQFLEHKRYDYNSFVQFFQDFFDVVFQEEIVFGPGFCELEFEECFQHCKTDAHNLEHHRYIKTSLCKIEFCDTYQPPATYK